MIVPFLALWLLQGEKLERAVATFPLPALAAAVAIHGCWLCARSEAWRLSLNASGDPVPRPGAHGASAAGYVAGMIQSASGLPVRAVTLKRLVAQPPPLDRSMVAEAPVIALEACFIAIIFLVGIATAPVLPAWGAAAVLAISVVSIVAMAISARRFSGHRMAAGLRIFLDGDRRGALLALVVLMTCFGLLRAFVVLSGAGLPHDPATLAILFATMGLLGALPLGQGAAPGAMLAVYGPTDAAAAASAGLAVVASSLLSVVLYAVVATFVLGRGRSPSLTAGRAPDPLVGACPPAASTSRSSEPPGRPR